MLTAVPRAQRKRCHCHEHDSGVPWTDLGRFAFPVDLGRSAYHAHLGRDWHHGVLRHREGLAARPNCEFLMHCHAAIMLTFLIGS